MLIVRRYLSALQKRWKLVVGIILASLLAGFLFTLASTPIYRATVMMKLEGGSPDILNIEDVNPKEWTNDALSINTQIELIKSRDLALRVVNALNLAGRDSFFQKMGVENVPPAGTPQQRAARANIAAGLLRGGLAVKPKEATRIVQVSFMSPDADLSAGIANAYAKAAIEADLDRGMGTTKFAREFLEARLAQTKARLEASEREMIAYARQSGLVDTSVVKTGEEQTSSPSLGVSNLVAINAAYADARAKRIIAEAQWRAISSGSITKQPDFLASPAVQALEATRAQASAEYNSYAGTRSPTHPDMKRLARTIQDIDRNIAKEATNFRAATRARLDLAERQEQALAQATRSDTASSLDEQDRNVQLGILKREVDTNRAFYDALLQRYKEISAASGSHSNALSIVDEAQAPGSPVKPQPLINLGIAFLIGTVLAGGLVFAMEQLDQSVRLPEQIIEGAGLALIGVVPRHGDDLDLDTDILNRRSDVSEAYRSVQVALNFTSPHGVPTPLLITSSRPSEGKSTTAFSVALSFARDDKQVLLIDADLRRPSLHQTLRMKDTKGLSEVLSNQRSLREVIQELPDEGVSALLAGPVVPDPVSLLSGPRLHEVLNEAQSLFDVVIIDGPPVMGLADAMLLAAACQGTLFVVEAGQARIRQVNAAVSRLRATNTPIIGAVLTKFDSQSAGLGSEHGYDGYYSYQHEG